MEIKSENVYSTPHAQYHKTEFLRWPIISYIVTQCPWNQSIWSDSQKGSTDTKQGFSREHNQPDLTWDNLYVNLLQTWWSVITILQWLIAKIAKTTLSASKWNMRLLVKPQNRRQMEKLTSIFVLSKIIDIKLGQPIHILHSAIRRIKVCE